MDTNKIKNRITVPLMALAVVIFSGCEETDYLTYNTSDCGIYFTKDTLNYSFGVTPVEITEYTYEIPVRVMGGLSPEPRAVAFTIHPDSTTATEGLQFEIKEAVIPANSIDGVISVVIYRNNLEGNYYAGYERYKLCIELAANRDFTPTLDSISRVRVLRFDNSIEQPSWLNYKGDKVWNEDIFGVWHPYKFIKMVEFFHAIEPIQPETYKKMVKYFGENLEHVPYGSFYPYAPIMRKYVLWPMYEFFSDDANHENTLSLYPDFPFDFPNPYGSTTQY